MNKQYGSYILATESTVRACGDHADIPNWISRGEVTMRGRETPTRIFGIAPPQPRHADTTQTTPQQA